MPRGGYRQNAGRKSGWNHVETQVIRVPKVLAMQLLEIARKLDEGKNLDSVANPELDTVDLETESKKDLVTESIKYVLAKWRNAADKASPKNSHWSKARSLIAELEPVIYEQKIVSAVNQSKMVPGQMSLLDQVNIDTPSEYDLVTESEVEATQPSGTNQPSPLTGRGLGRRLKFNRNKLKEMRLNSDFAEWSRNQDPEGWGWRYNEQDSLYYPVVNDFVTNSKEV